MQKPAVGGRGPGGVLCIEDPLESGNDTGRGSYDALRVKRVFEYAFVALKAALVGPLAFSPARRCVRQDKFKTKQNRQHRVFDLSVLGRIVRVNDDVTHYRRWVKDVYAIRDVQRTVPNIDVSADALSVHWGSFDTAGRSDPVSVRVVNRLETCRRRRNNPCATRVSQDSESSAEESNDRDVQPTDDCRRRPFARLCSRYSVRNTWNVNRTIDGSGNGFENIRPNNRFGLFMRLLFPMF